MVLQTESLSNGGTESSYSLPD
ncbi:hypothetical protein TNCV_2035991, partial [Trichonephila clavipes]